MPTRNPVWLPRPEGVDRPGDPVLTMTPAQRALWIEVLWYANYLTGYGAPISRSLKERTASPRPGDLVFIPDAMDRRAQSDAEDGAALHGIGYLICKRNEPAVTEEVWRRHGESDWNGECPMGRVWYVQYMPGAGDVCRWENASCMTVPRGGEFADEVSMNARNYLGER